LKNRAAAAWMTASAQAYKFGEEDNNCRPPGRPLRRIVFAHYSWSTDPKSLHRGT